eukprot:341815-Hanusia_phi.AAC.5
MATHEAMGGGQKPPPPANDVMRIFISTDNHLGHAEDNEMRKWDSFMAMEEVLQKATEHEADFLLLGGDLFDKNKPSRYTMVETVRMFKKYCLGERPLSLQPLALDPIGDKDHVGCSGGFVNYEDPCMNITLPVFIIHGNHDDPTGRENYSALDVLWNAGLVNYFGKQQDIEKVVIRPICLQKGNVKLALYGLGNMRDDRLFQAQRSQQGKDYTPVDRLPDWLHVIIWGHEHECRIDFESEPTANNGNVEISQPGSSVQTSLIAAESIVISLAIFVASRYLICFLG